MRVILFLGALIIIWIVIAWAFNIAWVPTASRWIESWIKSWFGENAPSPPPPISDQEPLPPSVVHEIQELVGRLLKSMRIVPWVNSDVLRGLYYRKDYAKMLGWIKNSMRLDLHVELRIVGTTHQTPPIQNAPMWIELPGKMPLFGTPQFLYTHVIVNVRKDLLDTKSFAYVVAGFAHELSHVVLNTIQHELQHNEKAVDLTAMILGYGAFITDAEIIKTVRASSDSYIETERLGYLTSTEARFALRHLSELSRKP